MMSALLECQLQEALAAESLSVPLVQVYFEQVSVVENQDTIPYRNPFLLLSILCMYVM